MTKKTSILLIDNHKLLRAGLRALIIGFEGMEVVAEGCYNQVKELLEQFDPDLILLNLVCYDFHCNENIISEILEIKPNAVILVIANSSEDKIIWRTLKQGALGCLLSDSEPHEIYQAVESLIHGGSFLPPPVSRKFIETYQQKDRLKKTMLSSQQITVLRLMSQGYSNLDIASQLVISKRTVEMHAYKIFKVLQVNNRTQAIQKGLREGILDLSDVQFVPEKNTPVTVQ